MAGLVGGLVGLAASRAFPPRYEAYAGLGVSLDYGRTPPLELIVEDRVLNRVASLLLSSSVLEQVRTEMLATHGADGDWAEAVTLRRRGTAGGALCRLCRTARLGLRELPESASRGLLRRRRGLEGPGHLHA